MPGWGHSACFESVVVVIYMCEYCQSLGCCVSEDRNTAFRWTEGRAGGGTWSPSTAVGNSDLSELLAPLCLCSFFSMKMW